MTTVIGAKPELVCPVDASEDLPLPDGRVELAMISSRYVDCGFAITAAKTHERGELSPLCHALHCPICLAVKVLSS